MSQDPRRIVAATGADGKSRVVSDEAMPLESFLAFSAPAPSSTSSENGLLQAWEVLEEVRLVDYKVRILTQAGGTSAVTRVMIESADASGRRWNTVGVSPNIIDASVDALSDSITWKLLKEGVPVAAAA